MLLTLLELVELLVALFLERIQATSAVAEVCLRFEDLRLPPAAKAKHKLDMGVITRGLQAPPEHTF